MGITTALDRLDAVRKITEDLKCATIYDFSSLPGPSALPERAGAYIIFDKKTKEVYYVGKTTNLRQRLYNNHFMGPTTNARLKKYLIDDPAFPGISDPAGAKDFIKKNCSFVFLLESDVRERGHLEGLLSFLTDCRYVDKEH